MPVTEALNDDDLAALLVADARQSSRRYVSQGLSALLPKRNNGSAPKPNTRFLKSLVRDADSHNAKLKDKEESEARERLRKIREAEREISRSEREKRKRDHRDGRESKRRRVDDEEYDRKRAGERDRHNRRKHDSRRSRSPERDHKSSRLNDRKRWSRRRNTSSPEDEDRSQRRRRRTIDSEVGGKGQDNSPVSRRSHHHRSTRHRSRSRSRQRRSRSPKASQQPSSESRGKAKRPRSQSPPKESLRNDPAPGLDRLLRTDASLHSHTRSSSTTSTTSDPLTAIIGPHPSTASPTTILKRGRGFLRPSNENSSSNIDRHFSETYNLSSSRADSPTISTSSKSPPPLPSLSAPHKTQDEDSVQDEWHSALSALHDRKAYREKQAARMREAGFTDEEVARWDKSASHPSRSLLGRGRGSGSAGDNMGDVRNVKWKKRGEEREWDVGKEVLSLDGANDDEEEPAAGGRQQSQADVDKQERKQTAAIAKAKAKAKATGADDAWRRPRNGLLKQFKSALG